LAINSRYSKKIRLIYRAFLIFIWYYFTYSATELVSLKLNHFDHQYYNYCTLNVAMTSVGVFLIVSNIPTFETKVGRSICGLFAKFSYGIYLVHILVLDQVITQNPIKYT
jgi:peptidoglycan/LPS O-acetylase OafA/YrhL